MTNIGSGLVRDLNTPLHTLVVGGGSWVSAVGARINRWITLEVDVEGNATFLLITVGSTVDSIVGIHGLVTKVRGGLGRTL